MTQFWTSRGYAFAALNHAGSTGYGREYRQSLDHIWGLAVEADAVSCMDFLSASGEIDKSRVGIVGQSAGGYTVLQASIQYPEVWAGGISRFGIGNWEALTKVAHKYESRILDKLFLTGNETEEQKEQIIRDRSPAFHADKIKSPVLIMQGSLDPVVPLAQAEEIYEIMKTNGIETKLVVLEGEGHGWKMKKNIQRGIEEEEKWRRKTLVRE